MRMWVVSLFFSSTGFASTALPALHVDPQAITVSGISSGAYMAEQMHVAFSKTLAGSASVAGGVYWCAKGDVQRAQNECQSVPSGIKTSEQVEEAKSLAVQGAIDPVENLSGKPVYVYASPNDTIINPGNSDKLMEFLKAFNTNITFVNSVKSAHGFPTLNNGGPCGFPMLPWILKCGYDAAGEILQSMYGNLNPKGSAEPSHLLKFSQSEFGDASTPLFSEGWIYVPAACTSGAACKLHMALHGCQMNPEYIQDQFARLSGFNEWAETNNIIILYPQSGKLGTANPYACWDWYGFTGPNYMTKAGAQMSALKKMIDRVSGN
jgi:poly(3-hydroxybutyrate) depolymerase